MALTLPTKALAWLAQALLVAGLPGLDPSQPLAWPLLALVLVAALKLLEARRPGERRLVALLQLLAIGLLAALRQDLAGSLLQLAALLAAVAALLALDGGPRADPPRLLRQGLALLLAALPLALLPFLLLPRLEPLGPRRGPLVARTARSGLSESLEPGAIDRLASDDAPAARVVFAVAPPPPGRRYWRVLVHERFDGRRWLPAAGPARPAPLAGQGRADQLWLVEPAPLDGVPWDGLAATAAGESDLQITAQGELRLRRSPAERRHYRLAAAAAGAATWRRLPPSPLALQLPRGREPRLEALAASWARLPAPEQRLAAAHDWFRRQPFRYSLSPGALPRRGGLDRFLFERRVGFCGHYASAFTALMRAAGVPARVVSGYRGGSWVRPLGGSAYLDLRQSDAHAWSEVWLPQRGWVTVDPTTWVGSPAGPPPGGMPWSWWQRQWWGLDVAWSRWWLGFDRQEQEALLQRLLGGRRDAVGWLLLALMAALLPLLLTLLRIGGGWGGAGGADPLRPVLERALAPLGRLGLQLEPGETLAAFGRRAAAACPHLGRPLAGLIGSYDRLRFAPLTARRRRARLRRLRRAARELRRAAAASDGSASGRR